MSIVCQSRSLLKEYQKEKIVCPWNIDSYFVIIYGNDSFSLAAINCIQLQLVY